MPPLGVKLLPTALSVISTPVSVAWTPTSETPTRPFRRSAELVTVTAQGAAQAQPPVHAAWRPGPVESVMTVVRTSTAAASTA